MERAILVTVDLGRRDGWPPEDRAQELYELARASGAEVVAEVVCRRDNITPVFFTGKGKAEEIALMAQQEDADVIIFNNDLNSTQQKNLEEATGVKTVDRTQLILDIFARRARSNEGKVQVELAQLLYLLPRLTGKGVMLSRLGGGIGTRGPGEKKLEVDRRSIRDRIAKLKKELELLTRQRVMRRKNREKFSACSIAIIGYTNAGKSTLLNALTESRVVARDKLFSTLDPTIRRFKLPTNQEVLFVDTVGFLQKLPHHLIEAFKATLEEVVDADMLLHIVDVTHPMADAQSRAVFEVLDELGVKDIPIITVLNKIDMMDEADIEHKIRLYPGAVAISALNKVNFKELLDSIILKLSNLVDVVELKIPQSRMDIINLIYKKGAVLNKEYVSDSVKIRARIPLKIRDQLVSQFKA